MDPTFSGSGATLSFRSILWYIPFKRNLSSVVLVCIVGKVGIVGIVGVVARPLDRQEAEAVLLERLSASSVAV